LQLSANKGDHRAQALLGSVLFKGEEGLRQAALGLFWLIVAKDAARPDEGLDYRHVHERACPGK
jgi:hypothetical protein